MSLAVSLRSETLKLRRTIAIYLCVFAAVFGPCMSFLEYLETGTDTQKGMPWTQHFLEGREPLCFVLLPMYVILICTLLLQLEYRDKTWKQVMASPQKLNDIFFAKFVSLQLMIMAFLLIYNLAFVMTGFVAELIWPALFDGGIDIYRILLAPAQAYILILGVSAIQFWLSLRFKSFIAPLAIGIGLWFMAPMLIFEFKWEGVVYYPYAFSIVAMLKKYEANIVTYQWYSVITAVVFLTLALIEFRRKKMRA